MKTAFTAFLLVLACSSTAMAAGGIGLTLTDDALNGVTKFLLEFFNAELSNLGFDGSLTPINIPVGGDNITLTLANITALNTHIGAGNWTLESGTVGVTFTNVSSDLHVAFTYSDTAGKLSGAGAVTASPINGLVRVVMGTSVKDGKLTVTAESTDVHFETYGLAFTGTGAAILNSLYNAEKAQIDALMNQGLSSALPNLVNTDFNKLLQLLPPSLNINLGADFDVTVDTTFVSEVVTSSYINVQNDVGFTDATTGKACPAERKALPTTVASDPTAPAQLFVSDSVMACPLWVVYSAGVLNGTITPTSVPSIGKYLNTSVFQDIVPSLYKAFPNDALDLGIAANAAPVVTSSSSDGLVLTLDLNLAFAAETSKGVQHACTLGMNATVGLDTTVTKNVLEMQVSELTLKFDVVQSSIGDVSVATLQALASFAAPVVEKELNKQLAAKAITLPSLFADPKITYGEGYVALSGGLA